MTLSREAKIYIAGHRGLAGSAIHRCLLSLGYHHLLTRTSSELDLTNQIAVRDFFLREKPDYVFLCAAKVGGILANSTYPADFIRTNLLIQTHVIHEAKESGVKRLIFLGSSCIYPRDCPQPIQESYLLQGPLELTNRPYAIAKIAGIEMCWAYNRQFGTHFLCLMPTNLFGKGDNYDLQTSHVLPALLRKMHEAKLSRQKSVTLWGTGNVRREFLHSDDLALAAIFLINLPEETFFSLVSSSQTPPLINVGRGEDLSIRELALLIAETVQFKGKIEWDSTKPSGTPRKLLDISLLRKLGWSPSLSLSTGICEAYRDFLLHNASLG